MGKIEYFDIIFDKPNSYYFGGETLTGRVSLRCKERLKINNVRVDIIGASRVHWYFIEII